MLSRKSLVIASLLTAVCSYSVGTLAQETFKSSKFLEYPQAARANYIATAATMAGVIATQNQPSQARCVDEWVSKNERDGFEAVLSVMRQQPNYHPLGVILAVLQKACGSFKYLN